MYHPRAMVERVPASGKTLLPSSWSGILLRPHWLAAQGVLHKIEFEHFKTDTNNTMLLIVIVIAQSCRLQYGVYSVKTVFCRLDTVHEMTNIHLGQWQKKQKNYLCRKRNSNIAMRRQGILIQRTSVWVGQAYTPHTLKKAYCPEFSVGCKSPGSNRLNARMQQMIQQCFLHSGNKVEKKLKKMKNFTSKVLSVSTLRPQDCIDIIKTGG